MHFFYSTVWLLSHRFLSDAAFCGRYQCLQLSRTARIGRYGPTKKKPPHQFSTTTQRHFSWQNDSSFDISKPVFDLYSLRSIRGDALAKYNSLNQSEPLRINLAALILFVCLASPWLVPELTASRNDITTAGGIVMSLTPGLSLPQGIGVAGLALLSGGAFVRECRRRSRQLMRLEKELDALDLSLKLPSSMLADTPFRSAVTVRELLSRQSMSSLVVLRGTADELFESLQQLRVLGRRLLQANAYVVVIPTDGSSQNDWGLDPSPARYAWLAEPEYLAAWTTYFDDTLVASPAGNTDISTATTSSFRWFGLKPSGRTFGSGTTPPLSWLQVMGRNIPPVAALEEGEDDPPPSAGPSETIRKCQERFYHALTTGNQKQLAQQVFGNLTTPTTTIDQVVQEGGRLDSWEACLADGARPQGMKIDNGDVTIVSNRLAYSTVVEFPVAGATLLAVQTWTRNTENSDEEWKLQQHQTIPWSDSPAGGTLICDCRGCVSLVRSPERRTFGGLIG